MYAEVAINAPVSGTFHYHIPPALDGKIRQGHLVKVSFGTAMQPGIVLALHDDSPVEETKPILERLDPQPVVSAGQIELAQWMSRVYLAPLGACLWLMLPPGIAGARDIQVTLVRSDAAGADVLEQRILDLLRRRGSLRGGQIRMSVKDKRWEEAVKRLVKTGLVESESILAPPTVRPKTIQTAVLAVHPDQIPDVARHLGRHSRRADLLEVIAERDNLTVEDALQIANVGKTTLNRLVKDGLVAVQAGKPPLVSLNIPPEAVDENLIELRGGYRQLHVLKVLARESEPLDVSWVYAQTGANLADLKKLADDGLVILGEKQAWRDSLANRDFVPLSAPILTRDQQAVWSALESVMEQLPASHETAVKPFFLLHGVTGSGKTEIYLRAIELALKQGRQAILLVPEIALTAQTVRRVAARFPGQAAVVHGELGQGERYDTWRRAREGLIKVVIGTRSALFTPLPDVGVVILDEEHDNSYKQSPHFSHPHYHARQVAEEMMRRSKGVLILGSATPDVETVFRAQRGDFQYLHLPNRIMGHRVHVAQQAEREHVTPRYSPVEADAVTIDLPPVKVVDMRDELKAGNTHMFSRDLHRALEGVLERGEQAMLYMNRRGQSTYVFCRDCGYIVICPRCDTPMTYHRQGEAMRCHHCGHQQPTPTACPVCRSPRIRFFGAGTQQVEEELKAQFPKARALRWDADTVGKPQMHEVILRQFVEQRADVLIGTQMIAKGLDLPLVTLVGVVSADLGLALPDFRAGERVFQLLMQVSGRAGRGLLGGQVILQTYQPNHYAIAAASKHDYEGFYQREIAYRKELGYPPFRAMSRIVFRYTSEAQARKEAERAAAALRERIARLRLTGTELIGPAPCFFSRIDKFYRWHLLVRGTNPAAALQGLDFARGWSVDIDPVDVL